MGRQLSEKLSRIEYYLPDGWYCRQKDGGDEIDIVGPEGFIPLNNDVVMRCDAKRIADMARIAINAMKDEPEKTADQRRGELRARLQSSVGERVDSLGIADPHLRAEMAYQAGRQQAQQYHAQQAAGMLRAQLGAGLAAQQQQATWRMPKNQGLPIGLPEPGSRRIFIETGKPGREQEYTKGRWVDVQTKPRSGTIRIAKADCPEWVLRLKGIKHG